jgi:hypothetical protein
MGWRPTVPRRPRGAARRSPVAASCGIKESGCHHSQCLVAANATPQRRVKSSCHSYCLYVTCVQTVCITERRESMTTIELPSGTPQSHWSESARPLVVPQGLMATPPGRLSSQEMAVGIGRFYAVPVAAYGDELPCWSVDPDLFFASRRVISKVPRRCATAARYDCNVLPAPRSGGSRGESGAANYLITASSFRRSGVGDVPERFPSLHRKL